jgi:hypothetical protein
VAQDNKQQRYQGVRIMRIAALCSAICIALVVLNACGEAEQGVTIDIQLLQAQLDPNPGAPIPDGFTRVEFPGSHRTRAGTFLVGTQTLATGWSITAFRGGEEPDGSRAISFRLNAAAKKRLAEFSTVEANLKLPLALRIDGRWADFSPLLRAPVDRMNLYGFTPEEVSRLEQWMQVR